MASCPALATCQTTRTGGPNKTQMAISNNITPDGASSGAALSTLNVAALSNGDFTFMWWVNYKAAISSGGFGITFDLELSNGNYINIGQNNGHDYLELWNGSSAPTNSSSLAITNNKWWHYALRRSGNVFTISISDENGVTYDVAAGATLTLALPGSFSTLGFQGADDRVQGLKGWTSVLTDAQVRIERERSATCLSTNLWINNKFLIASDLTDYSGNGRNWSHTGTLATVTGPTISDAACPSANVAPLFDASDPCCPSPQTVTSSVAGGLTAPVYTSWQRQCSGDGVVPSAADVVDDEDWAN